MNGAWTRLNRCTHIPHAAKPYRSVAHHHLTSDCAAGTLVPPAPVRVWVGWRRHRILFTANDSFHGRTQGM